MKKPNPLDSRYKDTNPEEGYDGYCAYFCDLQEWEHWELTQQKSKRRALSLLCALVIIGAFVATVTVTIG